tara:strand:- start:581 stop:841 length:261 start_codon:yes stop_codon:yes gene_type:complete
MKKADKLNLAFGKCFAKSKLTDEECEMIMSLNILELVTKHLFNDIQARKIMLWCQQEYQRINSPAYSSKEDYVEEELNLSKKYYRT